MPSKDYRYLVDDLQELARSWRGRADEIRLELKPTEQAIAITMADLADAMTRVLDRHAQSHRCWTLKEYVQHTGVRERVLREWIAAGLLPSETSATSRELLIPRGAKFREEPLPGFPRLSPGRIDRLRAMHIAGEPAPPPAQTRRHKLPP